MLIMPFGRIIALAIPAAFFLASLPAQAEKLASAVASHQSRECARSTSAIQQLATIQSATEARFQCLGLSMDGQKVKALRLETHSFASVWGHPQPEQVTVAEFLPAVVDGRSGAVLDGVPGHDAILLQGNLSLQQSRSRLVTSYLYNGFTGEYHNCSITLDRTPDGGRRLLDNAAHVISHIVIKTRQIPVIGAFGIATLEGACS
jgi:hypothetical protein